VRFDLRFAHHCAVDALYKFTFDLTWLEVSQKITGVRFLWDTVKIRIKPRRTGLFKRQQLRKPECVTIVACVTSRRA